MNKMPRKKKDVDSVEKIDDKKSSQVDTLRSETSSSSDSEGDISESKPSRTRETDHRFHKYIDGKKVKSSRVLYLRKQEVKEGLDPVPRLKEASWLDDNSQHHASPDKRELHEGDPSKCPNCLRYVRKNSTGPNSSKEPERTSRELTAVSDIESAWAQNPSGTSPWFELTLVGDNLAIPLISKRCDVNEALALFHASQKFSSEKKDIKVTVQGKIDSDSCPNARKVKIELSRDMRSIVSNLNVKGWAPILQTESEDLKRGKVSVKPRISVVYTPEKVKLETLNLFKTTYKVNDVELKPKEEQQDGRHREEGNDTTSKED